MRQHYFVSYVYQPMGQHPKFENAVIYSDSPWLYLSDVEGHVLLMWTLMSVTAANAWTLNTNRPIIKIDI